MPPHPPLARRWSSRLAALYVAGLTFAACAAPRTQIGSVSREHVRAEQAKQEELARRVAIEQQQRLDRVAQPLLRAAVPVCGTAVRAPEARPTTATVVPAQVCAYNVAVARSDVLNAWADGRTVTVTTAMMRFAADDDELAVVLAHEIAHNAMRHRNAKMKNMVAGALLGAAADIAVAAAGGGNTGGEFARQGAEAGAAVFSQDFEREADYIGLYLLAWAGRSIDDAATLWRRMAIENPKRIRFAVTHPTTAERFVRLEQWRGEIEHKVASGAPLSPALRSGQVIVGPRLPAAATAAATAAGGRADNALTPGRADSAAIASPLRTLTASAAGEPRSTDVATGGGVALPAPVLTSSWPVRADPGVVIEGYVAVVIQVTMRVPGSYGEAVPSVPVALIDSLGRRRDVLTNDAGEVTTLLRPGPYRVLTTSPVAWQGVRYEWDVAFRIKPSVRILNLTQDNATSAVPVAAAADRDARARVRP